MKKTKNKKSEAIEKINKKEWISMFNSVKIFFFILFGITIIQIILSVLGYAPSLNNNQANLGFSLFSLLGIIKMLIFLCVGYLICINENFNLRKIFMVSFILFIASIPVLLYTSKEFFLMAFIVKAVNFTAIFVLNYFISFISCLVGASIAYGYKKINRE